MSNYIASELKTFEFQGDTITAEIESLENDDFAKLLPFFTTNDSGETILRFEDKEKFEAVALKFLGKYVKSFEGLKDRNGQPISLETVIKKTYFMQLTAEMMKELFILSKISEDEEKKSDAPSEQSSAESDCEMTG